MNRQDRGHCSISQLFGAVPVNGKGTFMKDCGAVPGRCAAMAPKVKRVPKWIKLDSIKKEIFIDSR